MTRTHRNHNSHVRASRLYNRRNHTGGRSRRNSCTRTSAGAQPPVVDTRVAAGGLEGKTKRNPEALMDEFAQQYLAAKLRDYEQVIEDLEAIAETPGDFEALQRLSEYRAKLLRALNDYRLSRVAA